MKLSIVATLYQSAPYINEFYQRASAVANKLVGDDFEIILVNDGSPDHSLELAVKLTDIDSHVVIVDLSRNFGHHKAMMAGLAHASGERIFLIDIDLEEEPEWLINFVQHIDEEASDIVYGAQEQRKGNFFERWSGQCFYQLFKVVSGLDIPMNIVTSRLMTRRYVDALLRHEEREVFMAGLCYITGFKQTYLIIKKHSTSDTTYTFRRKMAHVVNSVTSFSNRPLIGIFYIGLAIFIIAAAYVVYLVSNWMIMSKPVSGWTSVMVSIWLLGGLVMSSIGVVGIYISKIFSETKRRPNTIVRQIYKRLNQ